MENESWGTETLRRLSDAIGDQATHHLVYACGGIRLYIPMEPKPSHPWAKALTAEQWSKAVTAFGGEMVDLPTGRYMYRLLKAEIIEMAERGASQREIAIKVRCSERYVRRVLHDAQMPKRGPRVDERQTKLFE